MHLILDGRCSKILTALELKGAVSDTVDFLSLNRIDLPLLYEAPDGITLIQVVSESHIAVHTVEDFIHLDIFSCKDFDVPKLIIFLKDKFLIQEVKNTQLLARKFGG